MCEENPAGTTLAVHLAPPQLSGSRYGWSVVVGFGHRWVYWAATCSVQRPCAIPVNSGSFESPRRVVTGQAARERDRAGEMKSELKTAWMGTRNS